MSMFGWSAGDLLQFARLVKEVLDYYQSVPQNLRESFERLRYVADHLNDLSDVLANSGWPTYDKAPELKDDLDEARDFFSRYASLSEARTVSTSRLWETARLGLGQDKGKLRRIDENLKDHLEKMSAFKQHVILICSLKNLQLAQQPHTSSPGPATYRRGTWPAGEDGEDDVATVVERSNTLGSSRLEPDNMSVISNAFSAIKLASKLKKSSSTASVGRERRRVQPPLELGSPTSPILDVLKAASEQKYIDEFIDEIVRLSTDLQLYSQNPSLPQSPQQLAKITSTAMKLCASLQPQHHGNAASPRLSLPEVESPVQSFRQSIFSTLSRHSHNTSVTEWTPDQADLVERSPKFAAEATSMPNVDAHPAGEVAPPLPRARRGPDSGLASQSGTFIMDIGPPAKQLLAFTVLLFEKSVIGVAPIECKLEFADAGENSPFCSITAIAVNQRRKSLFSGVDRGSHALTPQTHLNLPENDLANDVRDAPTAYRRIFLHNFIPGRRPFPHTLHPDVEGPANEPDAPYTITFAAPQLFEEEGVSPSPTYSTSLKYICDTKAARDMLQSLIFGKALLFSAGISKVITTGSTKNSSRDQQAVRVWLSKDCRTKSMTVYFKDGNTGGNASAKRYKEYQIRGLHSSMFKARRLKDLSPGAPVEILVVEEARGTTFDSLRRSSTTSAQTISSAGSAESATSNHSICCIQFSQDADRKTFLSLFV